MARRLLKKRPRYQWADGDAFDRENLRDELIKLRILSKDLMNKKESVNELKQTTKDMVNALLKVKNPMPKEIESALIMMVKGYGLNYVNKEVKRDAKGFYKSLKQMVTFNFQNMDYGGAMRLMGEIGGVNILVGEDVAGSVTASLTNVPWDKAFNALLDMKNYAADIDVARWY